MQGRGSVTMGTALSACAVTGSPVAAHGPGQEYMPAVVAPSAREVPGGALSELSPPPPLHADRGPRPLLTVTFLSIRTQVDKLRRAQTVRVIKARRRGGGLAFRSIDQRQKEHTRRKRPVFSLSAPTEVSPPCGEGGGQGERKEVTTTPGKVAPGDSYWTSKVRGRGR